MIKTTLLLITLYLPFTAAAAPIDDHFNGLFHSSQIDGRFCGRNIDAFIQQLGRHGDLPNDFRRVVIRAPHSAWHMESMLIGVNSRFGKPEANGVQLSFWYHHVIGVSQGRVYDFSFAQAPKVLPVLDYLRSMFVPRGPFMVFGSSFRIRGMGPNYGPADGRAEANAYTYEIQKVDAQARQTRVALHPDLKSYLGKSL